MSTTGKEYKLAIRIAGAIDKSFTTSLVAANTSLKRTVIAVDKDFTALDKGFDKIMSAGKKCFSAIATASGVAATAIGAATAASISVGSEFESAFSGVRKTVDATEEEYTKLRQDILDMTKVIPSSASEIAGVMEIAGQLGIAKESLTDFTETMINLGVSTNLSAEDAATALAKFANIVQMDDYGKDGVSNFERLGSVVVDLGNNFATTEEDIVTMATRLASTGDLVGLTEAQIIALSTAMSSVGVEADAGGSSMSKLLKKMQIAVETNSGALKDYASVSGMTGEQFSKTFKEDAVVALSAFIAGVDDVERNGKSAIAVLDDMGLNEIRLSNTIQALAGGEEVMSEAIAIANEAWYENTALAIEAGKRYETVESKVRLMKNSFQKLGIAAYDELREPFVDMVETVTDKIHGLTEYVSGPDGISKWLHNIGTELPTLQRKAKSAWKTVSPFFDGLLNIGKWFLKNPAVLTTALKGIGTALVTYKIASNLTHFVKTLMTLPSLNPATVTILGIAGAITALATAFEGYKAYKHEMVTESLAEHFGDIALSLEEVQEAAGHILSSDSLGGVKKALEAFEDIDGISSTIEATLKEINKMNWKVSIGMELTVDEQEQYKTAISEYIAEAQDYVAQSQYAVHLNLEFWFGDSEESEGVIDSVDRFYSGVYAEMVSLGEQLSKAVNDAFADGILDPDEIDEIANIQAKMAKMQERIAQGEYEATLSLLQGDVLNGASLDAESYKNLMAAAEEQKQELINSFDESYRKGYAEIYNTFKSGNMTEAKFNEGIQLLQEERQKKITDLNLNLSSFGTETVFQSYGTDITNGIAAMKESISTGLGDLLSLDYTSAESWTNGLQNLFYGVKKAVTENSNKQDRAAWAELYEMRKSELEDLQALAAEYTEAGKTIPSDISAAIDNIQSIGAMAGDTDAIWYMIGNQLGTSEEYATTIATAQKVGGSIPQALIEAMTDDGIMTEVNQNVDYVLQYVESEFQKGIEVTIPVSYEFSASGINARKAGVDAAKANLFANSGINHRATGGLATSPELTWFAENGPEMAIPIDGSKNAVSLWEQTGRLLGMDSVLDGLSLEGGSGHTIEYSPTIQFYGEAPNKESLTEALRVSQDEFENLMERYLKTHGRVSFG